MTNNNELMNFLSMVIHVTPHKSVNMLNYILPYLRGKKMVSIENSGKIEFPCKNKIICPNPQVGLDILMNIAVNCAKNTWHKDSMRSN